MQEIKVYDDARRPRDWNALLKPSQCAVFFKDAESGAPLSPSGQPVPHFRDCTFLLFDHLKAAQELCETIVQRHANMCCEVLDHNGRAKPPLMVIVHASVARKDELSASSVRWRNILAVLLFLVAVPLFWLDWWARGGLILPTFLGITMILAGVRLVYWNFARRQRLIEEERRIAEHLERETKAER